MKDKAVPVGLVPLAPSGSRIGLFRVVKIATGKAVFLLSFLSYFIIHIILSLFKSYLLYKGSRL